MSPSFILLVEQLMSQVIASSPALKSNFHLITCQLDPYLGPSSCCGVNRRKGRSSLQGTDKLAGNAR